MPVVRDQFYQEIRFILYFVFGILSLIAFVRLSLPKSPKIIKLFIFTIIAITFEVLLVKLLALNFPLSGYTDLFIPLGILVISYTINLNKKELSFLVNSYAFLAIVMGVMLVLYYGGGFILRVQYIGGASKNQTGPIISIAIISLIFQLFNSKNYKRICKFLYFLSFSILGMSALVVLRNRAGLLGVGVVLFIYLLSKMRNKIYLNKILIITLVIFVMIILILAGFLDPLINIIIDSFTLNYDVTDLDSLSAGRIRVYLDSVDFISEYPLFGEINSNELFYDIPHNYILNKWVNFGLLGSLPFIILYIYLWIFLFKNFFAVKNSESNIYQLAIWLLLLVLTTSFFEYAHPFSPGVTQIMVWFMIGIYLRINHNYKIRDSVT
jgi:O-antigen ligase